MDFGCDEVTIWDLRFKAAENSYYLPVSVNLYVGELKVSSLLIHETEPAQIRISIDSPQDTSYTRDF